MDSSPPQPHVLREYALLADGERGALVGPRGDIAWLCAPRWDSGSVFGSLLGAAGHYTVTPAGRAVWGGSYDEASLVWRHRWSTTAGFVECHDALAQPAAPGRLVLLRRIRAVSAPARVHVRLAPAADYGTVGPSRMQCDDDGCRTADLGSLRMRWSGAGEASASAAGWSLDLDLAPGQHHDLVLEIAEGPLGDPVDAGLLWAGTRTWWREWVGGLSRTTAAAPRDAAHAACVLRGLTSVSGGMVAAATASLPERAHGGDDYDYRYVWIRDQCYAGRAAARAGIDDLLDDAVRFLSARLFADGPRLRPAYTVDGGPVPAERNLDVPGYPGGGTRIGNRGGDQFQLDAFGELLLLFAEAAARDRLDVDGWRAVEVAVAAITARRNDADAGVWELEDRDWTHSRLICAAGLRAVARHADAGLAGRWSALADEIVADTASRALHASGRWQRAPDDERHDAALLLPAVRGAVPAQDPRSRETLRAYLRDLTREGYAYRFRVDERPLGAAEGAFLLCSFLVALACDQVGDDLTARHFFERARSACGPPGLLTEEFDVTERQPRGNLPQAFVHALLLECAATLAPLERSGTE